jgi:hypothetical protein
MTGMHRKTLKEIFHDPVKSSIVWDDIEAMLMALGAQRFEGNGSRVRFLLNGIKAVFHRPHPQKETDKGVVKSVRRFLQEGGTRP